MPERRGRRCTAIVAGLLLPWLLTAAQLPVRRPLVAPPPPDLDLVLAYVTVTASKGAAPRLSAADFELLEDNMVQKIDYFAVQDQAATIGILWGAGTSFDDPAPDPDVRECPRTFMRNMVPGSEYFFIQGDTVTTPYTTNLDLIPRAFRLSSASGDSVYLGLDVLKEGAHSRKILLVITNPFGGSGGQLHNTFVERRSITQGYQIHVMSFTRGAELSNHEGQIFLNEVAELTGGSFYLGPASTVPCVNLAQDLRVQYLIGYHSTNKAKDGKWRRLNVKIDTPKDGPKLTAHIRRGYYAAKDSR